ncbi:lactoylglutathione lyase [Paenibacillus selenitireducens]|uniref:Lactoylglutathione lyase n=1 Tax=Paenibacillus selenitireducens TaxID=1324314 RepID=A0A1T2X1U7_9BACL|nr:lactoylglutathione lyase [Paenibacillus selenitireducens]
MLEKLEHMQIPVRDLDESIAWYVQHLGFTSHEQSGQDHAFLTLPEGPMLMLWETQEDTHANFTYQGQTMPVLLYATSQIQALHDHLKNHNVEITFFQNEGFGWVLKFIDLNGNMWGVIEPNGKNNASIYA